MWLINLAISLFNILKVSTLECLSVINRKSRPKILDVNEAVGEALFYPYNVLVNKCSGSCNTLNDPMARICVPKIIKNVNMKVYNFLWHESCKCVCRLNSSVCNSKQIWNSDTCRCDCNEDFAGIINCTKGYMWNPSACETMMNNRDNKDNDNTITYIFIGLFSVLLFVGVVFFCVFGYFKWIEGKKLFKNKYTYAFCARLSRNY